MNILDSMKNAQRLAYDAVLDTRQKLIEGMTEKQTAELLESYFIQRGHRLFFHRPFVWFGERTGFAGFKRPGLNGSLGVEFLPTDTKLKTGMAVTLDVAPAINGTAVDIGYSFSFGANPEVEKARQDLKSFRQIILEAARERVSIAEIYRRVEQLLSEKGYRNCHGLYPLGVLGHRIGKLPLLGLPKVSVMGFHPQAYAYLIKERLKGASLMTAEEQRPLSTGMWAVEPHLGGNGFGVKFEEILVVTDNEVYWLDDSLPHLTEVI